MTSTLEWHNNEVAKPPVLDVDSEATRWLREQRDDVLRLLDEHGTVVLRSVDGLDEAMVRDAALAISSGLFVEKEAMTGRDQLAHGVYSPSIWPQTQQMCMHHELSYRLQFPGKMLFACIDPADSGGEIEVADGAAMLDVLPPDLVDRVEKEGWILARSFGDDMGLSVEDAFGSSSKADIESYCEQNKIDFRWTNDGGLQTRQRRPGVVYHQRTERRVWFNQLAFLSEWTLDLAVRDFLIDEFGADGLPFNTFFGNGEPLTSEIVSSIADAYTSLSASTPMQSGDITVVDNVRMAHGRAPFEGDRRLLVAMCDPVSLADVGPRR